MFIFPDLTTTGQMSVVVTSCVAASAGGVFVVALIVAAFSRSASWWVVAAAAVTMLAWVSWPPDLGGAGWSAAPLWSGEVSYWWIPITAVVTTGAGRYVSRVAEARRRHDLQR